MPRIKREERRKTEQSSLWITQQGLCIVHLLSGVESPGIGHVALQGRNKIAYIEPIQLYKFDSRPISSAISSIKRPYRLTLDIEDFITPGQPDRVDHSSFQLFITLNGHATSAYIDNLCVDRKMLQSCLPWV